MLLENGKTGLFCFTRVGEPAHISKISFPFRVVAAWPRGRGNDTPGLRVPAARSFEELPCFRVKFSNIHPASESDFLSGIFFRGESIVMQISFVMLIFLLFLNQLFWGRGKFTGQIA